MCKDLHVDTLLQKCEGFRVFMLSRLWLASSPQTHPRAHGRSALLRSDRLTSATRNRQSRQTLPGRSRRSPADPLQRWHCMAAVGERSPTTAAGGCPAMDAGLEWPLFGRPIGLVAVCCRPIVSLRPQLCEGPLSDGQRTKGRDRWPAAPGHQPTVATGSFLESHRGMPSPLAMS